MPGRLCSSKAVRWGSYLFEKCLFYLPYKLRQLILFEEYSADSSTFSMEQICVQDLFLLLNLAVCNQTRSALQIKGPRMWNDLPNYVKDCTSLNQFKMKTKYYLINSM